MARQVIAAVHGRRGGSPEATARALVPGALRQGSAYVVPRWASRGMTGPEVVDYLDQLSAAGVMVEGAADETLAELRVVAS